MGQVVLISEKTLNTKINAIDDIVEIQDDDVSLTGAGYECYKVLKVEGKTGAEIKAIVNTKHPERKRASKMSVVEKWCFMEEKEVWKNADSKWCDVIVVPKYPFSFKDITEIDRTSLADKEVATSTKDTILDRVTEKMHLDAQNNVEVADLNPVKL